MRGLTVRQPFAAALASGRKCCETRSRDLGARPGELLAVHASLGMDPASVGAFRALPPEWRSRALAERGVILAVAEVLAVGRVGLDGSGRVLRGLADAFVGVDTDEERALGDWSVGRVLVLLGPPVVLPVPVPARGALYLWRLPEEVLRAVREGACQHETTTPEALRVCGMPAAEHEDRLR